MKLKIFLLVVITFSLPLFADTIYLKSGRKIVGIIESEDSLKVKLKLAIGLSIIKKEQIDSISLGSADANKKLVKEWAKEELIREEKGKFDKIEEILRELKNLYFQNEDLNLSSFYQGKKKRDNEKEVYELTQEFLKYNSQIMGMDYWDNPKLYSELYDKRSKINARIEELRVESSDNPQINHGDNREKQLELMSRFTEEYNKINYKALAKEELEIFNNFLAEYKGLTNQKEDNSVLFQYTTSNSIVVKVKINDRITGSFILDTGASSIVFCENFAKKLNLDLTGILPVKTTVADGREVDAFPVLLSSVKVGRFRSSEVGALVLKTKPMENIDGLLGMSYLKNYIINLDAQARKLYFQEK